MMHNITDEEIEILKASGYSEKAIKYYFDQVNLGKIKDPHINQIQIGECGDLMFLFINLGEGGVIDQIKFRYVGCPALAASGSSMTKLAKGKTVFEASELTEDDIMKDLGSLPEDHMHCPVLAIKTLKSAIDIYLNCKLLTEEEHDNYIHFCGLTGKHLEALSSIHCTECPNVKKCENDHIIITNRMRPT